MKRSKEEEEETKTVNKKEKEMVNVIMDGDMVVVYESFDRISFQKIDSQNGFHQCKFGKFMHKDMIGLPFGSRLIGNSGSYIYVVEATAELWSRSVLHRTQILYVADISVVISQLGIIPGSRVIESGTGSGSLSTSIARALAPTGHLFTFEFNSVRAEAAKKDFLFNNIDKYITVECRDVLEKGFPEDNELIGKQSIDAVFLDLPSPQHPNVIKSSRNLLKIGGHLCSFSPCIEQVQKTCEALFNNGFTVLKIFETLLRQYEVSSNVKQPKIQVNENNNNNISNNNNNNNNNNNSANVSGIVESKPFAVMKGHTGYLLFARRNKS